MLIRPPTPADIPAWLALRAALWPDYARQQLANQLPEFLANPSIFANFLAQSPTGTLTGFAEASIRRYADGSHTSNAGYLEGWYVAPEHRRQGIGKRLVQAAENWARAQGAKEMASDCLLDNAVSEKAHAKLGYHEPERLIHFRKTL